MGLGEGYRCNIMMSMFRHSRLVLFIRSCQRHKFQPNFPVMGRSLRGLTRSFIITSIVFFLGIFLQLAKLACTHKMKYAQCLHSFIIICQEKKVISFWRVNVFRYLFYKLQLLYSTFVTAQIHYHCQLIKLRTLFGFLSCPMTLRPFLRVGTRNSINCHLNH